jgi:flagellar biosynthetic protein FliQ
VDKSSIINAVTNLLLGNLGVIAPSLIIGLVVAIIVSAFMAMTQIQEQSIAFVVKLAVIVFILVFSGNWMLTKMIEMMSEYLNAIPTML